MSWTRRVESIRASLYTVAVLALAITVIWSGTQFDTTTVKASGGNDAPANHMMFPGTGTGAIPDNVPAGINVTFNVTGVTGTVSDIWISMDLTHTWVGDIDAKLTAPNGTTSHVIFASTGATTPTGSGDNANLGGVYRFIDNATGTNWWAQAAALPNNGDVMPAGDYRTTQAGPQPAANTSPPTVITAAFASIPAVNGTWTLNISDNAGLDTGSINAATLAIDAGTTPPTGSAQFLDFFGNNLTDFAVFTFPTAGGQVDWFVAKNDNPTTATSNVIRQPWGASATDIIPNFGNWAGDTKTDFNIYRNNSGTPANTYLVLSNPHPAAGTVTYQAWGTSQTDSFGKEGDYNGDGIMDFTAVRTADPVNGGLLTWYILNSGTNTFTTFNFGTDVTDIALPGANYDGVGGDDPAVIRIGAGGLITWLVGTTSGTLISVTDWGDFDTDFTIPGGDYDGDGRADFMVWRGFGTGTNGAWYLRTATGATSSVVFGIAGAAATRDTALRGGDYDGDGKDDIAVYRPGSTQFIVRRSSDMGTIVQGWGISGNTNIPMSSFGIF